MVAARKKKKTEKIKSSSTCEKLKSLTDPEWLSTLYRLYDDPSDRRTIARLAKRQDCSALDVFLRTNEPTGLTHGIRNQVSDGLTTTGMTAKDNDDDKDTLFWKNVAHGFRHGRPNEHLSTGGHTFAGTFDTTVREDEEDEWSSRLVTEQLDGLLSDRGALAHGLADRLTERFRQKRQTGREADDEEGVQDFDWATWTGWLVHRIMRTARWLASNLFWTDITLTVITQLKRLWCASSLAQWAAALLVDPSGAWTWLQPWLYDMAFQLLIGGIINLSLFALPTIVMAAVGAIGLWSFGFLPSTENLIRGVTLWAGTQVTLWIMKSLSMRVQEWTGTAILSLLMNGGELASKWTSLISGLIRERNCTDIMASAPNVPAFNLFGPLLSRVTGLTGFGLFSTLSGVIDPPLRAGPQ